MRLSFFYLVIISLLCFIVFFNSCSKKKTELDFIKETLEMISESVEEKKTDSILLYISETYSDNKERNKEDIRSLIKTYINRYKGIIVNILEVSTIKIEPLKALIETDIALSSGIARALRKVTNIASRYYHFKVRLIKENSRWTINDAEWKYITKNELSSESKEILNDIIE